MRQPCYVTKYLEPAPPENETTMNQHLYSLREDSRRASAPVSRPVRAGMSLVEVMCAMVVISVALLAAIGQMQIVNTSSDIANQHARIQEVAHSLLDRIVGSDPANLGGAAIPWSQPRYEDTVTGNNPPLDESGGADDLKVLGVIQQSSGLPSLKIYVEYYRGLEEPLGATTVPGVMDTAFIDAHDFTVKFQDLTFRTDRRLSTTPPIISQVVAENPVVIRLIIIWDPNQRIELYAVKRRPTS